MRVLIDNPSEPEATHRAGERITEARPGSLYCVGCGFAFPLTSVGAVPECPNCGGSSFKRAALFDPRPTVDAEAIAPEGSDAAWLEGLRGELEPGRRYLAYEREDEPVLIRLQTGWTRIGRSAAADVRLDDATVSRRHALVVLSDSGELRALDDRSLNGLFVNGEAVDWAPLTDGDELEIGRYRVHVLEA
jgi:predicted RNA-binding Zn-ribbon protein involved in translation (DUF1610 family)